MLDPSKKEYFFGFSDHFALEEKKIKQRNIYSNKTYFSVISLYAPTLHEKSTMSYIIYHNK